ncbi:MAG: hypothetical protein OSA02_02820 [Schleiferiaceae bacterium]|nr:hypothetical protein [Schleiferiaceae bacterium]
MSIKIIHAISGPRNISTALMYSFSQRENCAVFDEPFYGKYLFDHPAIDHPGARETLEDWPTSTEAVLARIKMLTDASGELYLKNMAHHMVNEDWKWAANAAHVFWIRHPRKVIASFSKVIPDLKVTDIGLTQELTQWSIVEKFSGPSIIVDTDEMLKDPKRTMPLICAALGISWQECMLKWPSGEKVFDGPWWPHWYTNAHNSTCFGPPKEMPDRLDLKYEKIVEDCLPAYRSLFKNRLKLE